MPAHSRLSRQLLPVYVLGSLLVLFGPSACFDPDSTPFDDDTTTGTPSTTGGPLTPSSSDGISATSTPGSTSSPLDDSTSTTIGLDTGTDSTSTGEPVSSTSTGESSSSGGESSTGEPPGGGYGDCTNNPPAAVCLPDEQCLNFGAATTACSEQGCVAVSDCAEPLTGNPTITCADIVGDGTNDCYLACGNGETCPDGMICFGFFVCVWPFPPGVCPDQDLGSAVPQSLMGDNSGLGDDHYTSCGNGGGEDATYQFTAPVAGSFSFDTFGTGYDTILAVLDGCGGAELACNDDAMMLQSQVIVPLAAGQTVIVVVDGYSAITGPFILNITMM